MTDIERLLEDAGERWRAAQPATPRIDPATFARHPEPARRVVPIAAVGLAAVLVVVLVASGQLGRAFGNGVPAVGGEPGSPSLDPSAAVATSPVPATCDVTVPSPTFVPPGPNPPSPADASAWYGTPALWTMLDRSGTTWAHLPTSPDGLTQKTFWWSTDWVPEADPEPAITVVGTQLDGTGTFTAGPGTNAVTEAGTAMLVGVTVPTAGCWRLDATYLDATLSIVVDVKGD
jgi:hypothetical protein